MNQALLFKYQQSSGVHLFTRMVSSFDVDWPVGTLFQYHGVVIDTIFGNEHDMNLPCTTCSPITVHAISQVSCLSPEYIAAAPWRMKGKKTLIV